MSTAKQRKRIEAGVNAAVSGGAPVKVAPPPAAAGPPRARVRADEKTFWVPLELIDRDPDQPRKEFPLASLIELAESLKISGQLQACIVRPAKEKGRYVLVAGERRFRAAELGEIPSLLCRVEIGRNAGELLADQLAENVMREELAPMDLARALGDLHKLHDWTQAAIAERVGLTQSAVSKSLSLLSLPGAMQTLIEKEDLPPATAREIAARVPDAEGQVALAEKAVALSLTRDQVALAARELFPGNISTAPIPPPDVVTKDIPGESSEVAEPATSEVNASGVFVSPEVIEIPIPKATGCSAKVKVARGDDGLWRYASDVWMPMGKGGHSTGPVALSGPKFCDRHEAIGQACARIARDFGRHGHLKAVVAVDAWAAARAIPPAREVVAAPKPKGRETAWGCDLPSGATVSVILPPGEARSAIAGALFEARSLFAADELGTRGRFPIGCTVRVTNESSPCFGWQGPVIAYTSRGDIEARVSREGKTRYWAAALDDWTKIERSPGTPTAKGGRP